MEAARTPCLRCWGATALLVTFLSTLTPQASPVAEWNPGPKTTLDTQRFGLEGSSGALDPVLARSLPDSDQELQRNATTGQEGNVFVDNQTWKGIEEQSPEKPPVDFLDLAPAAGTVAAATLISTDGDSSLSFAGSGIHNESNEPAVCLGCPGENDTESLAVKQNESALEASGVLSRTPGPTGQESAAWELGGTKVTGESQEDMGSGDQHLRTPAVVATFLNSIEKEWRLGTFLGSTTTLFPSPSTTAEGTSIAREPGDKSLSPDSAETDHLLQVFQEAVLLSPTPSGKPADPNPKRVSKIETSSDPETEQHLSSEIWVETTSSLPAQGSPDLTLPLKEMESWADNTPPPNVLKPPEPPSKKLLAEIIDIDYYDHSDLDTHSDLERFPGGDSTKTVQDKKKSSWVTSDLYNDFITFDESDFYPTTSFYTDGDEDDEEEEMEVEDGTIGEPEDEEDFELKTHAPKLQVTVHNEKPTSMQQVPQQTFITPQGELHPKSIPETMKEPTQTLDGSSNSSTECRNGYLRHNRTCKSVCDIYPTYCYNGGQCYLVENSGAFCRCNTQDYIWHKGVRCESIITDFQVMCVAVGTAALVVLLLFMMTVFFAKKLYLLKTENYKLRKRNRYRTPSELHNDNFSLSTIAEGSHPNEDPNAIHKLQEPTKSFVKDEEPFNIQNAMSPKHGCDTEGPDSLEVNCLQNNLT